MRPPDATEDALGLLCPLPVLRARAALKRLQPGDVLELLADDPAITRDLPAFCAGEGHDLVLLDEEPGPPRRWRARIQVRHAACR